MIRFAWTPKRVEDGVVWLQFVHWTGSSYLRWVPEARYNKGERAPAKLKAKSEGRLTTFLAVVGVLCLLGMALGTYLATQGMSAQERCQRYGKCSLRLNQ